MTSTVLNASILTGTELRGGAAGQRGSSSRLPPPERAVVIGHAGYVPARLRVAQEIGALHGAYRGGSSGGPTSPRDAGLGSSHDHGALSYRRLSMAVRVALAGDTMLGRAVGRAALGRSRSRAAGCGPRRRSRARPTYSGGTSSAASRIAASACAIRTRNSSSARRQSPPSGSLTWGRRRDARQQPRNGLRRRALQRHAHPPAAAGIAAVGAGPDEAAARTPGAAGRRPARPRRRGRPITRRSTPRRPTVRESRSPTSAHGPAWLREAPRPAATPTS